MTTAPYTGRAVAEYRAACTRHQTKTDILANAEEAAMFAADTRSFCPACQDEDREAKARRNGHARRELARVRGRPVVGVR